MLLELAVAGGLLARLVSRYRAAAVDEAPVRAACTLPMTDGLLDDWHESALSLTTGPVHPFLVVRVTPLDERDLTFWMAWAVGAALAFSMIAFASRGRARWPAYAARRSGNRIDLVGRWDPRQHGDRTGWMVITPPASGLAARAWAETRLDGMMQAGASSASVVVNH